MLSASRKKSHRPSHKPDWLDISLPSRAVSLTNDRHENRRIRLFRRRCHDTRERGRPRTPRRPVSSREWTPDTCLEPLGLICPKPGCAVIIFCSAEYKVASSISSLHTRTNHLYGYRDHIRVVGPDAYLSYCWDSIRLIGKQKLVFGFKSLECLIPI